MSLGPARALTRTGPGERVSRLMEKPMANTLQGSSGTLVDKEIRGYLADLMAGLERFSTVKAPADGHGSLSEQIFTVLTDRQFCHLSRGAAAPYRDRTLSLLEDRIRVGEPVSFWYDVGPGYHASLRPGEVDLSFEIGLSELLILFQIVSFCHRVAELYPPGARFSLVVDNLCALRTNDIPVARTERYCLRFLELIRELKLDDLVGMTIESEEFELDEYDRVLAELQPQPLAAALSADDLENVERFLGRRCSMEEAVDRADKYRRTGMVTEHLLLRVVRGVRMTQRASETTLGFRAFPGGDSRTQCGEVAIGRNTKGKLRPVLLTSRNVDDYDCTRITDLEDLSVPVSHVTFAEKIGA